ncbi:MAG: hypothetical protein ACYCWW_09385 [Deltaproteobacteria bacterium]
MTGLELTGGVPFGVRVYADTGSAVSDGIQLDCLWTACFGRPPLVG